MSEPSFRRDWLSKPIFGWARHVLPTLSDTEREAIEAGDVWWDADLFAGNPDWAKLLAFAPSRLTAEEQAFLDGPVDELCHMLNDWQITFELCDLPPEVWDFLKRHKFFAMIIPKEYGGLGFSAFAHSEVIRKLSTRSISGAVTAMVPNSLGPGELLLQFGTKAQQDYWLPRLADAREIPCFGLTSPEAGSDAASMTDSGVVCRGTWEGREVVGIRLNWHKRYITLAPVATLIGLAFKLYDPDHLIGEREDIGITVALVPTDLPGVEIGRRHLPAMQAFQNGPTRGHDVFIPIDNVIGGVAQVGEGWKMLMSALAAGRGISLPSLSAAGAAFAAHTTGAYARIREQFHQPIGRFPAIQERLGRMAATVYLLDAARRLTCAGIDHGHKPAVITAIMKEQATERLRVIGQRRHGRARRQGRAGRPAQLSRHLVPLGPDRHHGRRRQHRHPQPDPVRAGRDPQPSLSAQGDGRARGPRSRARPRSVRPRLLGPCRAQRHQCAARLGPRLERSDVCAGAGSGAGEPLLPAARTLCLGVRARGRCRVALARRRAQAPGDDLRAFRRRALGALSPLRRAQAFRGRGPPGGGSAAGGVVHAERLRHHRGEARRDLRELSQPAGGVAPAVPDAAVRRAPSRSVRPADAGLRRHPLNPSAARERLTVDIFHGIGDDGVARLERAFALVTAAEPLRERMRRARVRDIDQAKRQAPDQRCRGRAAACRGGGGRRRRRGR